jgi:sporulation protein YlmC with PRC-barrel domain
MSHGFTDDDRGKDVHTTDGVYVGEIYEIKEEYATVDRQDGTELTQKVMDMLGLDGDDDARIDGDDVDTATEDTVHLRY